jgi:ParB/RepB/Spo0J family partition protein
MKKNAKIIAVKKNTAKKQSQAISETPAPTEKEIKVIRVLTSEIDYSPLNHRRHYNEDALNSFAEELKRDDIFSPLEVRKKPVGRYELVFGERRLRAAKIGGLETVPVILKDLTDEQVIERQLLENLQREDPHPMDYAYGIERMQTTGLSMDEISSRLGKTKPFIYNRIKLNSLLPVFQEMFLAGKISHPQALAIAAVSNESQQELYDKQCIK